MDKSCKQIHAWKVPEKEHQFFYSNNDTFKSQIDMEFDKYNSDKRILALKKLYHDYKNKATFKKNQ